MQPGCHLPIILFEHTIFMISFFSIVMEEKDRQDREKGRKEEEQKGEEEEGEEGVQLQMINGCHLE
jgi:hypothetical protein